MNDIQKLWAVLFAVLLLVLAAAAFADPPGLVVDDFDDGDLEAQTGLSWLVFADGLMGGPSRGRLELVERAAGRALRLAGEAIEAERPPYVSVWTAVSADGLARDLSAYRAVGLRARGTPGVYHVALRDANQINFATAITVGADWADFEAPFATLAAYPERAEVPAFSPSRIGWLGVTTGPATRGSFALEIDDVVLLPAAGQTPVRKTQVGDGGRLAGLDWRPIAEDATGDAVAPSLPDARALAWATADDGMVWFRLDLAGARPAEALGINLAFDLDGDPANGMAWWGSNTAFYFDRLATAYLMRGAGYWQGWLGMASAAAVAQGTMDELATELAVAALDEPPALFLGVPRAALPAGSARMLGAVGSAFAFSDDLPSVGAATLALPAAAAGQ